MATRVEEAFSEREQKENANGKIVEIEIPYIVFEAETAFFVSGVAFGK